MPGVDLVDVVVIVVTDKHRKLHLFALDRAGIKARLDASKSFRQ